MESGNPILHEFQASKSGNGGTLHFKDNTVLYLRIDNKITGTRVKKQLQVSLNDINWVNAMACYSKAMHGPIEAVREAVADIDNAYTAFEQIAK